MIDEIDAQILSMLQENARIPNAEIARRLDMAPSATLERIRKLEARGIILGYHAKINPKALGLDLLAYVTVRPRDRANPDHVEAALSAIPEVQEVHLVSGDDSYLLKLRVANAEALGQLLRHKIHAIEAVQSTRSIIVLTEIKEESTYPMSTYE